MRLFPVSVLPLPLHLAAASPTAPATPSHRASTAPPSARDNRQSSPDGGDSDDGDETAQPATAIVVTARKLDAARTHIDAELGATAYALDNDAIEDRPGGETGSIGAILGQTPGVALSASGLTIRGSGAVQVRINNVVVPEAISDPADRLSSRFAATTRVITGTLPAQFGFAPGGVVSVTTKNGLYHHGGQLEMFAGNHGMAEPAFEWAGSSGATSLFGSGSYETGSSEVAGPAGQAANDRRQELGGLGFADHLIDDQNRISAIFGGSHTRHSFTATSLGPGQQSDDSGYFVGTWQHSSSRLTVQSSLFAGQSLTATTFATHQRLSSSTVGTQVDASYSLGKANTVRAGFFINDNHSRFSSPVQFSRAGRTAVSAYAQDQLLLTASLALNAGARIDWLHGIGTPPQIEPRASVVWTTPGGFSLHAGYARYAAAAPVEQQNQSYALPDETDDYFGGGVQQEIGAVTLGIEGYWRSTRNLLLQRTVPGLAEPYSYTFQQGRFSGVELSATYATRKVNAWANVSFSRARGRGLMAQPGLFSATSMAGAQESWIALATDRPVSGSGGITWHLDRLSLSADVLAGSGTVTTPTLSQPNGGRAPAYASLGLSAVYHMRLFGRPADVRADLTNLTNVHYLINDGANLEGGWTRRDPGRAFMIGIEQAF